MPQYQQFPLPDTAEGLTEADVLAWRVAVGDTVAVNQVVVEVETAKAAVELPCPYAGVVTELLAEVGQTVPVGQPLLTIDCDPGGAGGAAAEELQPLIGYGAVATSAGRRRRRAPDPEPIRAVPALAAAPREVPRAKPPVRRLAKNLGVRLDDLPGSAADGTITREDVQRAAAPVAPAGERRVRLTGVRKAMAQAMVASAFTAPHVTEMLTVDVTATMALRARLSGTDRFADLRLTPLTFAAKAVCLAARRTPELNASLDGEELVYHSSVHLGIAAATPRGLVVPVVRDADSLTLAELAGALAELATTARAGHTPPEAMTGGTFTITNVGVFGVDTGTPILSPGQTGILALGAVKQAPWVVDGELAVRTVCQLALSFDHRVVDGQQGSQFLADVGTLLSDPGTALAY